MSMDALAQSLRSQFLHRPFGIIQFWGFAVVRPNDQCFELVSVHHEADRLDLVFVHESRQGLASVLSVWGAEGLTMTGGSLQIATAQRLRLEATEAHLEGGQFRIKTQQGEGLWPLSTRPALRLAQ